jgi:autotransporter-associated beta strand protein
MRGVQGDRPKRQRALRAAAWVLAATTLCTASARAQDATWLFNPGSNDFDTAANWNPATVPTGTAFFNTSNAIALTFSANPSIGGWTFNAGASNYTFSNGNILTFTGAGIVIDGGSATITNIGTIEFDNTSSAGSAAITNISGDVYFFNGSTAGGATLTNGVGSIVFTDTSSAGSATIINNTAGTVGFINDSTAGSAIITNNGIGTINFNDTSSAGSAAITNNGIGTINFDDTSTAGDATITNTSTINFDNRSTAGNAALINNAGGVIDFSLSSGPTGNNQLSAGSIAGAGNFYLGANQLTVGGNNLNTTVSGVISDCGTGGTACANSGATGGSLVKIGAGTLTLSGDNTYTGATIIYGGSLEVDGSIADSSSVTVNAGGTLSGTGTVDPTATTTIADQGILAPGNAANPTGTLTFTGNLAFQSAALYLVTINGANASSINVSGAASLGGTVQVAFISGPITKSYDILHATGGLGGTTFAGATSSAPNFDARLSYSADDVFLEVAAALGAGTPLNRNQQNVANAISNFFNNSGTLPPGFANLFNLTGAPLSTALTQLDGEDATGAERGAFDLMNEFLGLMLDPFVGGRGGSSTNGVLGFAPDQQASVPPGLSPDLALAYAGFLKAPPAPAFQQRWSTWASAFGGSAATNGDPSVGSNNVTTSTYGYAAGMDYHSSPDTVFGFSLAGGGTNWNLANALGTGRSDAFLAGLYGVTHEGPWSLGGALAFANNWFTTNRIAMGDQLTASFQGQSYAARLEGGYRFALPAARNVIGVTPYAAIQAQNFHTPSYSEADLTAGGFGLSYNAQNGTETRSELGSRFDDLTALDNLPLILRAKLAWAHDWVSNPALNASFESLPGTAFTVNGAPIPRDSALTSAGAQLFFTPNWSLTAKFDGEFASGTQLYAGTGTLRYTW